MADSAYTLATYRVKPGRHHEFIECWNQLAELFVNLPNPPIAGTLIRNLTDRSLFHSFGPWHSEADVRAMRENGQAGEMFARLRELCDELTAGDYEVIRHIDVDESLEVQE